MTTLDRLCADWSRLDLVKIDAEGAESLVWDGMQQTLKRFPRVVVLVELHLQRDPPQTTSFLHQLERSGYSSRFVNYDGEIAATDAATILANPQEHWMLSWSRKSRNLVRPFAVLPPPRPSHECPEATAR
jgi:hypothetical protein